MSYLVMKDSSSRRRIPTHIFNDPRIAQSVLQPMRWKILNQLTENEKCAKELSKTMGTSEQVICYHIRELEKAGLVQLEKTIKVRGATAKYYLASPKAITVIPSNHSSLESSVHDSELDEGSLRILEPFISRGRLNGRIVLGSPEVHGIFRAGARCGDRGTDIALFLGSLLAFTRQSVVRLDTEMSQQELQGNLIVVGGPRVNSVTMMLNEWLPITYELTGHDMMISRMSSNSYSGESEGAVQIVPNPMNQQSRAIIIAGNSHLGTRAATLAFVNHTDEIALGNSINRNILGRIISGSDNDEDGLIDTVEFLE